MIKPPSFRPVSHVISHNTFVLLLCGDKQRHVLGGDKRRQQLERKNGRSFPKRKRQERGEVKLRLRSFEGRQGKEPELFGVLPQTGRENVPLLCGFSRSESTEHQLPSPSLPEQSPRDGTGVQGCRQRRGELCRQCSC